MGGHTSSMSTDLAAQCRLPPHQVKKLVRAFQKKSKKGQPISPAMFRKVLGELDEELRTKNPLLLNSQNVDVLFYTLDINHDGARADDLLLSTCPLWHMMALTPPADLFVASTAPAPQSTCPRSCWAYLSLPWARRKRRPSVRAIPSPLNLHG